ncbi:MAG: MFS transporter [Nocardioidaceae bacterium]
MTGTEHAPAAPARGSIGLVTERCFGAIFWGKLLSATGVWVHSITAAIVVYQMTGSSLMVGLVTVAQFTPQLLLTPLSGRLTDQGNPVTQILAGRLVCLFGSGLLAGWIWLVGEADGVAGAVPVLVCSFVVGLGFVVGGPAMQSIVPSLIRPGELATAMALNTLPMTVARVAGPAVGAYVAAHHSPAISFAIAASTHLVFTVMILLARIPRPERVGTDVDYSVRAAVRYIWLDRPLLMLIIGVSAVAFGTEPTMTLAPSLSSSLGSGQSLVGWLVAAFGAGSGVGFVLHTLTQRRIAMDYLPCSGLGLMAVGIAASPLTGVPAVAVASFAVAGVGFTYAMTSISTLIQQRSPEVLRGRVMALWLVGFVGSRPLAAALDGYLADTVSLVVAFATTAALVVVAAVLCRPSRLRQPAPAADAANGA